MQKNINPYIHCYKIGIFAKMPSEEARFSYFSDDNFAQVESSKKTRERNASHLLENLKPYLCEIVCKVGYKKTRVKCFKSGKFIRNAITGIESRHEVGSRNEDFYFKMAMPGFGTFFFDGPGEAEKHLFIQISDEIKNRWLEKSSRAKQAELVKNT